MAEVGGRGIIVVLSHVVALKPNTSLAICLHGLLLIWEMTTYFQ